MIHFKKISDYCIQFKNYTISKAKVNGVFIYEIWDLSNDPVKQLGKFKDAKSAKLYLESITAKPSKPDSKATSA